LPTPPSHPKGPDSLMEKNNLGRASSLLVSLPAVLLWLVLCLVCAAFEFRLLSGLLLFLFMLGSAARYWGSRAMLGVSMDISCEKLRLYPGMSTQVSYTLKNEKFLPLVWLELSQNAPEKDCLRPDESFEEYEYIPEDDSKGRILRSYRRSFSLVMGYETLELSGTWTACRRGLYKPDFLLLRSGDGFGLSQVESLYPTEKLPEFVVYPKSVDVDLELFLRNDWERSIGSVGYMEDMSVLRGTRPYQSYDSWKRINWRQYARNSDELKVNFYETIQPRTVLFILDSESFCGLGDGFALLEESLEILGSVLSGLFEKGVCCGLCLPASRDFKPLSLPPCEERSAGELLYFLAGLECKNEQLRDKDNRPTGRYKASVFERGGLLSSVKQSGTVSLITAKPGSLSPRLLNLLEASNLTVFSADPGFSGKTEFRVLPLSVLRKGAGS